MIVSDFLLAHKSAASLVLIALILMLRFLMLRHLQRMPEDEENSPQRWINSVKNISNLFIAIGLIIIWLTELRYAALSIAAFAVAFVVATREFIQCFLGALYQASSRAFVVGDWIKIGPVSGQVVRSDWLSTTLLEIDIDSMSYAYTGKSIVLPNNRFITDPVQNLNYMRRYVTHSFALVRDADPIDLFTMKDYMLQQAKAACAPFNEVAKRYSGLIAKRLGVDIVGPEASVRVQTNSIGKNVFTVSIFCPTEEAVNIEQKLTEDFMRHWYRELKRQKDLSGSGLTARTSAVVD
jgi:small-conductance mechanosensitive channel